MREPRPLRPIWPPPVVRGPGGGPVPARAAPARRSPTPLTHHEILALAEPFTRRGRHVDLAASDRLARRLLFKPRLRTLADHGSPPNAPLTLKETLQLDNPAGPHFRLTRTLTDEAGRVATLRVEGPEPGRLIEQVDAIDPGRQFPTLAGLRVASSYRLETGPRAAGRTASPSALVLIKAVTGVAGIRVTLDAQVGHGMPAEIRLETAAERSIRPPEDLLAVLGRPWGLLRPTEAGWRAHLRIPSAEPTRTPDVELKLARTLEHLVATLGMSPKHFHRVWRGARRRVLLRQTLGLLAVFGSLAAGPAILLAGAPEGSPLRLLSFGIPALLILVLLARHETLPLRLPPLPQPLPDDAWDPIPRDALGRQ